MKPLKLKIAGLQSYRELQEIDFEPLCEVGVFGIFGPTGSGKSTILDAITLSLYGKVERALNGTQGIMNQAEDKLSVSFSFQLTHADGYFRYRVERQFKRNGPVSIQNSLSRFILEEETGDQVLADKANEVNRKVEELIGLSMQDFTRAVVLPQGKFAEFLSLKGSDRRQMLQRLFHLEKYGDRFIQRLSARAKESDQKMKEIVAEQQGLGNASEEAVSEALERWKTAKQLALQIRAALQKCELEYQQKKQVKQWQDELEKLQRQLQDWFQKEAYITGLENQLQNATAADSVYPYYVEWESAKEALHQAEALSTLLEQQYASTVQEQKQAQEKAEQAQKQLAANETSFIVQLEKYQQALSLQEEVNQLKSTLDQDDSRQSFLDKDIDELKIKVEKEKDLYRRAMQKQSELKMQLKQVEISSEDRRQIISAYQDKQSINAVKKQLEELQTERIEKENKMNQMLQSVSDASNRAKEKAQKFHGFLQRIQEIEEKVQKATFQLASIEAWIPAELLQRKQMLQQGETIQLAAQLAVHLEANCPCPVCGSSSHPNPATHPAVVDVQKLDVIELLNKHQIEANQQLYGCKDILRMVEAIKNKIEESDQAWYTSEAAASAVKEEMMELEPWSTERVARFMQQNGAAQKQIYNEIQALESDVNKLLQEIREEEQQFSQLTAEQKAVESMLQEQRKKEALIDLQWNQQVDTFKKKYSNFTIELMDQKMKFLNESDSASEAIRISLDKSIPFIEQTQQHIEQMQEQWTVMDKKKVQLQTEIKGSKKLLEEKQQRLYEWIGDESVDILINKTTAVLQQYRQSVQDTKSKLIEVEQLLQETSNQRSAASQGRETALKQMEKMDRQWENARKKTSFLNDMEMKQALLAPDVQNQYQREVKQYRETETQWKLQLQQVEEQLQGQSITEEAWTACEQALQTSKQNDEAALQERAKAERDLEDMQSKHEKWKLLNQQLQYVQVQYQRLSKLQTVFRGNAFVEYIAEEQLMQVSRVASERLGFLTRQRYAIEVDSNGGFVIRDDANGGVKRPVSTLSGGETFLTSLALALALSTQIQLRGQFPLEFFFLDEGFGTLDQDLLETVITALEKLHMNNLTVGIISHVPELRARLPRKLIIQASEPSGEGSKVFLESL